MTAVDWAALAVSVSTLIGALAIAVRFLTKQFLSELKPNGGSSLRDEVNRQGDAIKRLENRLDSIYIMLMDKR
jgi:hypothetical protein